MRRADLAGALLVIAFGAGVAVESWRMPRFGSPYGAPGLFPFVVGVALVLFGILLALSASRMPQTGAGDADQDSRDGAGHAPAGTGSHDAGVEREGLRLLVGAGLLLAYVVALSVLPYWLATGLFLAISIQWFHRRHYAHAAVISAAATTVISLLFSRVFFVPLP